MTLLTPSDCFGLRSTPQQCLRWKEKMAQSDGANSALFPPQAICPCRMWDAILVTKPFRVSHGLLWSARNPCWRAPPGQREFLGFRVAIECGTEGQHHTILWLLKRTVLRPTSDGKLTTDMWRRGALRPEPPQVGTYSSMDVPVNGNTTQFQSCWSKVDR